MAQPTTVNGSFVTCLNVTIMCVADDLRRRLSKSRAHIYSRILYFALCERHYPLFVFLILYFVNVPHCFYSFWLHYCFAVLFFAPTSKRSLARTTITSVIISEKLFQTTVCGGKQAMRPARTYIHTNIYISASLHALNFQSVFDCWERGDKCAFLRSFYTFEA